MDVVMLLGMIFVELVIVIFIVGNILNELKD